MNKEAKQLLRWGVYLLVAFLCGWWFFNSSNMPISHQGLVYTGGPLDGNTYVRTLKPGVKRTLIARHPLDWLNKSYRYPVTQRDYIISSRANEGDVKGKDAISYPSKDSVMMTFNIALYFDPNWNAEVKGYRGNMQQKFHERIGVKYRAWTDDGWRAMLAAKFRKQIENALQKQAANYTAEQIYTTAKFQIEKDIAKDIEERMEKVLGDNYFTHFRLKITRAEPPNKVKEAYNKKRAAEIGIEEQKALVEQANEQAKAAAKLDQAGINYAILKAIEKDKVQVIVVPSGSPVAVPVR